LAHQPQIVKGDTIQVLNPEVSKAYYDELRGQKKTYIIDSPKEFLLYLNLLVPKSTNPEGRYSATLYKTENNQRSLIYFLDGQGIIWKEYFEEYGGDDYYMGSEYETNLMPGHYEIEVVGNNLQGKYVLAIGKKEEFPLGVILKTLVILPQLKINFFNVSPLEFFWKSKFGPHVLILLLLIVLIVLGIVILIIKKVKKNKI